MTCAMCAKTVEKSLRRLPGVLRADVNLGKETAALSWNPDKIGLADIEKAVADAGYQVVDEKKTVRWAECRASCARGPSKRRSPLSPA
jgi:Cu+-exporting ATPase